LILVKPEPFQNLKGISIIPLADGRGFLALEPGKGVADLEIAVIDRLETKGLAATEQSALQFLRQQLRQWRQEGTEFESRSIVVARRSQVRGRPLSPLSEAEGRGDK
jgi:inactivated superfamily I helicase